MWTSLGSSRGALENAVEQFFHGSSFGRNRRAASLPYVGGGGQENASREFPCLNPSRKTRFRRCGTPKSLASITTGSNTRFSAWIDACGRHCRAGQRGIDSAVDVFVAVMILVALQGPTGGSPAPSVGRRSPKRLGQLVIVIHVDIVGIVQGRFGERGRAVFPRFEFWTQPTRRIVAIRWRRRPRKCLSRIPLPQSKQKNAFSPLRNPEVSRIDNDGFEYVVAGQCGLGIKIVQIGRVPRPQYARHVFHEKRTGRERVYELEVDVDEFVSLVLDTCIVDPMRRESLARRPADKQVALFVRLPRIRTPKSLASITTGSNTW